MSPKCSCRRKCSTNASNTSPSVPPPRRTGEIRPANGGRVKTGQRPGPETGSLLPCRLFLLKRLTGTPAPRAALEGVGVVEEPVEHGAHGGHVPEDLAPVFNGPVRGSPRPARRAARGPRGRAPCDPGGWRRGRCPGRGGRRHGQSAGPLAPGCRGPRTEAAMAFREVTMLEVKEVLRLWLLGVPKRRIAQQPGFDVKTMRRYVAVARGRGVDQVHGLAALDDGLVAAVVAATQPPAGRPRGDGWTVCEAHREFIAGHLGHRVRLSKIGKLLRRRGVEISYDTLRRYAMDQPGFGSGRSTVKARTPLMPSARSSWPPRRGFSVRFRGRAGREEPGRSRESSRYGSLLRPGRRAAGGRASWRRR